MKDEAAIQGLRKEVARIKEATTCGEQLVQSLRNQLTATERELAALTATLFVGVVYEPICLSYKSDAFGLVPDMEIRVMSGAEIETEEAVIRLVEDLKAVEVAVPGREDTLTMNLEVGQEVCLWHRPDPKDGLHETHLSLHVRVFASLEEAIAWSKKM